MNPNSMIVEAEYVIGAREEVATKAADDALAELAQGEPTLAGFIEDRLAAVAGKLALSGAPTAAVQGVHEDVLTVVLTGIQALRRGHNSVWKDSMPASPLIQMESSPQPKPPRQRKTQKGGGPEQTT
jgi:hypothetical protein